MKNISLTYHYLASISLFIFFGFYISTSSLVDFSFTFTVFLINYNAFFLLIKVPWKRGIVETYSQRSENRPKTTAWHIKSKKNFKKRKRRRLRTTIEDSKYVYFVFKINSTAKIKQGSKYALQIKIFRFSKSSENDNRKKNRFQWLPFVFGTKIDIKKGFVFSFLPICLRNNTIDIRGSEREVVLHSINSFPVSHICHPSNMAAIHRNPGDFWSFWARRDCPPILDI